MKRVIEVDECSPNAPSILTLLISHNDGYLRRHVLKYCYRKANVLARSCRVLHALFRERDMWCYGIERELRAFLNQSSQMTAAEVERACSTFDFFFNGWPADMPAVYYAAYGEMLSWIWDHDLIRMTNGSKFVAVRDRLRYHRWCFGSPKDEVRILHTWTAYQYDDEGDHWFPQHNAPEHEYCLYVDKGPTFATTHGQGTSMFWRDFVQSDGTHFRGYCTDKEGLHGVCTWNGKK